MSFERNVLLLPGDGIGGEVLNAGVEILRAVEQKFSGLKFHYSEAPCGAGEFLKNGDPLPKATIEACRSADAVLLGAMGLPDVRWPDGREMAPQIDLREIFGLYAGVRPVKLYNTAHSPLRHPRVDYVLVREQTEGLFASRLKARDPKANEVRDEMLITRAGAERLFRFSFRLAQTRRRKVTLVDKANVLPSMAFFRQVFYEVAREFPDVEPSHAYVDAMALYLVQCPERFDVLVTENMFGDILSDLAAGTVGGMGLAPSADIGDKHAIFQPAHGTAPDIAGQGKANPVATILSVALMLRWFNTPESIRAGDSVETAVAAVLADPANATPDIGGKLTTTQLTARIREAL